MPNERRVSVNGIELNTAEIRGEGSPLIAFHGVVRRWQDLGPVLPALGSSWNLLAVDQRGHGKSDRAGRYLVADYVSDAVVLLNRLAEPAVIIGHSLGALVALGAAAAVPHLVRAIVLEDPPSSNFLAHLEETPYLLQFEGMRRFAGSDRPLQAVASDLAEIRLSDGKRLGERRDAVALRFLASCLADLDPSVLTPVIEGRWLDGFDPLESARSVKCPVLLLVGDHNQGGMLPATDATQLAESIPDCVRIDLPGIGHQIHATEPTTFLRYAINFLDSLPS